MSEEKAKVAEILRRAIKGEEDGYKFYNLLAEKTTNPDAKRKLEHLRDDEKRHRETLIEIYHKEIGPEVGELPDKGIGALAQVFRKGHLEERKTEMEFIDLAIEAELAATDYYHEQRDAVDDEAWKKVFDQLATEEHTHFELLQAERDAISGNYYWFGYDSGSPLEH
jgi:rubrerythrin